MEEKEVIHLDYSLKTVEERKELVNKILNAAPPSQLTNKYIDKLDGYLVDQFPLRDEYRSIKALYNYNVLNMLVNNNIYIEDGYIFKSNYPTNISSINNVP